MTVMQVLIGAACGVLGAAWHLLCLAGRARLIVRGRRQWALALFPLGLLGPALAVLAAARVGPLAAWLSPLGLVAMRAWALRSEAVLGALSAGDGER